jgi:hypothetical protein
MSKSSNPKRKAKDFIANMLVSGPIEAALVIQAGMAQGFSYGTLRRAKRELGVVSGKPGLETGWIWVLPGRALRR